MSWTRKSWGWALVMDSGECAARIASRENGFVASLGNEELGRYASDRDARFAVWARQNALPKHDEHVSDRARFLEEAQREWDELLCEGPHDDDSDDREVA